MSFVTAQPEILTAAAGSLSGIGDSMTAGSPPLLLLPLV